MSAAEERAFTAKSAEALTSRAIPVDRARELGIAPVINRGDLPEELRNAYRGPGMVITWRDQDREVPQYRPDDPGDAPKYLFPSGAGTALHHIRDASDGNPTVLVEGSLKGPSVAAWAPEGWGVVAFQGCWSWKGTDLSWAEGREVVALFDADTATNLDVWNAAVALRESLEIWEPASVRYARMPDAKAKEGIDDVLGRLPEKNRGRYLEQICKRAADTPGKKPPAKKADAKRAAEEAAAAAAAHGQATGRPTIAVNGDRNAVIDKLVDALKVRDGDTLFCHGGALSEYNAPEHRMRQVERGRFTRLLAKVAFTVTQTPRGELAPAWPDANTLVAVLSEGREFSEIRRIMRAPFMRTDGTLCTTPGYDPKSRTYLDIPPDLKIRVPDRPTGEQVKAARVFLTEEWLGDMPFPEESDRANALALTATPFVRDHFPVAPIAAVSGLQMGVGKGLFGDCWSILTTGEEARMESLPEAEEEVRKQITALLRQAPEQIVFDETHVLQGKSLARVLTAKTWGDRVLGVSEQVSLPNVATWVALGNNIAAVGDMLRRYYLIRLRPAGENPQDRPASAFRHADLRQWTRDHRAELLEAVLTIIRAWHVGGRKYKHGDFRFGSFERWQETVGGILQTAGQESFLDGLQEARGEGDTFSLYWTEHLLWLVDRFGTGEFTTAKVTLTARNDTEYAPPPDMRLSAADDGYSRALGNTYRTVAGRWFDGKKLEKTGTSHGGAAKWAVRTREEGYRAEGGDSGDSGDTPTPPSARTQELSSVESMPDARESDAHVCAEEKGRAGQSPVSPLSPSGDGALPGAIPAPRPAPEPAPARDPITLPASKRYWCGRCGAPDPELHPKTWNRSKRYGCGICNPGGRAMADMKTGMRTLPNGYEAPDGWM